ncbi:MAG: type II secretion system minor pseudopilin GspK [Candidatus Omnitrophota bacterium]|jgi:general secretion pathway protein K
MEKTVARRKIWERKAWRRTGKSLQGPGAGFLTDQSGVILIVVLWVVAILSVFILGLGRRASVELALTQHQREKFKARHAAMAGLVYAMACIRRDGLDPQTRTFDTLYQRGIKLDEGQTAEDLFGRVASGDGYFEIRNSEIGDDEAARPVFGFEDEESKINVNLLSQQNYKVLGALITYFGFDEDNADILASAVIDWKDSDDNTFNAPSGAERDFYLQLDPPRSCKNYPFESVEEIRMVRGMTEEIFQKIKPYITVYPFSGRFQVNLDTAPRPVLVALARGAAGNQTNTEQEDADGVVEKILQNRVGEDGHIATADDQAFDINHLSLNSEERIVALMMYQNLARTSNYFRISVNGSSGPGGASSKIEAVVSRDNLSILYWKRQ